MSFMDDRERARKPRFHEQLPEQCPPFNVEQPTTATLWRLLSSSVVTSKDFESELLKNSTRKFRDQCGGASISLVPTFEQAVAAVKLPVMKKKNFTHAVEIRYDPSYGVWHNDKPTHCHFWPYKGFDFTKIVGTLRKLP